MPEITVDHRAPSVSDYRRLRAEGNLTVFSEAASARGLSGSLFAVTLRDGEHAIGMGRVIGDGGCFIQITDIVISPSHRGRGLAHVIMQALMIHVRSTYPGAYLNLLADVPADRLYAQYGFAETALETIGMAQILPE